MSPARAGFAEGARNIKAVVEYDGTAYAGFQHQPGSPTIQDELERALSEVTQEQLKVVGAGRTDAGTHARGQVIHFLTGWKRSLEELHRAGNALLPSDIAIKGMAEVPGDFHARFSALTREYRYTILNREIRSPLERQYSFHYGQPLDEGAMGEALQGLVGTHDFASFGQPTQGDVTVRDVLRADCIRQGEHIHVDITANAFLRHMVRAIVGTLLLVGRGALRPADVKDILEAGDRSQAGPPAPAHGLCLVRVNY
ncbi:MAG: tRNA pseudouridine(38-40) synthase TruA [Anaerolineae bacterium]|nr:tRNA pseudouridine(38-40) synthase TruA [Anaerolineae bacterium]